MKKCFLIIVTFFLIGFAKNSVCNEVGKKKANIKLLVLIIDSDTEPVYAGLRKIWRSYMHRDPEHVEAYFIRGNPRLTSSYKIEGDTIWSKTMESFMPGIINKTILSIEAFLPRIGTEFDYVLRTNMSSFYIFPRLLKFLETCPDTQLYCGCPDEKVTFCSGSGFLLSPDLAEMLVRAKSYCFNNRSGYDDQIIGKFFNARGVKITQAPRVDFYLLSEWRVGGNNIPENVFQVRVKCQENRLNDIPIQMQLLKRFYP